MRKENLWMGKQTGDLSRPSAYKYIRGASTIASRQHLSDQKTVENSGYRIDKKEPLKLYSIYNQRLALHRDNYN
jgi:hypothetical protein